MANIGDLENLFDLGRLPSKPTNANVAQAHAKVQELHTLLDDVVIEYRDAKKAYVDLKMQVNSSKLSKAFLNKNAEISQAEQRLRRTTYVNLFNGTAGKPSYEEITSPEYLIITPPSFTKIQEQRAKSQNFNSLKTILIDDVGGNTPQDSQYDVYFYISDMARPGDQRIVSGPNKLRVRWRAAFERAFYLANAGFRKDVYSDSKQSIAAQQEVVNRFRTQYKPRGTFGLRSKFKGDELASRQYQAAKNSLATEKARAAASKAQVKTPGFFSRMFYGKTGSAGGGTRRRRSTRRNNTRRNNAGL